MNVEVHPDAEAVAEAAAVLIAAEARTAVAARGRFTMAISGGRTPWLMLRALAGHQLPWDDVHVLQVDERVAPAGDPDRNLTHLARQPARARRAWVPSASTPCPWKRPTSRRRRPATRGPCAKPPDRRPSSTSSISASVPTDIPRRWCPAIPCST